MSSAVLAGMTESVGCLSYDICMQNKSRMARGTTAFSWNRRRLSRCADSSASGKVTSDTVGAGGLPWQLNWLAERERTKTPADCKRWISFLVLPRWAVFSGGNGRNAVCCDWSRIEYNSLQGLCNNDGDRWKLNTVNNL